jgi:integrase
MPRKVRDSNLETRTARGRLKVAHKPYFRLIEPGLHLGYRKLASGPGTWLARRYSGAGKYAVENLRTADGDLIIADDFSDADGHAVLSFGQAQEHAKREVRKRVEAKAAADGAIPTVRTAVQTYVALRDARESKRQGRPVHSDAHRLTRYVIGREVNGKRAAIEPAKLADEPLYRLTIDNLLKWRAGLPDDLSASAKQRLVNDLKAALNNACTDALLKANPLLLSTIKRGLAANRNGYDGEDEDVAVDDNQILTDAQIGQLIDAAQKVDAAEGLNGDLYRLVVTLAATGCRYSQATRMRVSDYQRDKGRLMVPTSRKGRGKKLASTPVPVGRDVIDALLPAVTGRPGKAWLLERWGHKQVVGRIEWVRDKRRPWRQKELTRPWQAIREQTKMPDVIAYALRHSSIVRGLRQGLPVRLVAALHDTSTQMIERHYSKWITSGLEELAARAVVPLLPSKASNVRAIRQIQPR